MIDFSVVIPVFNGAKSISQLVESIEKEFYEKKFEIILVNDGSKDNSAEVCKEIAHSKENITFVNLRKNFGEFNAVICGLSYVKGKYGIIIDDDFQNPPCQILKLIDKAEEGDYDVVYSYYEEKKHHWFRNIGSKMVNYLTTYLLKKPKDLYLSSFKLIKKEVIDEIIKFKLHNPYIDGLIFQVTDNVGRQLVEHHSRRDGESNYSLRKLISLFLTIIFGYSLLPLRLTFLAGFFSILFSLFYMLLYALSVIPEWGSPIVIFMCGVILCALALIGEYLGNTYLLNSGKPQYIVKSVEKKKVD
ncbi:MAG: glycosyltransferase family 2 protein [Cytophagaceae bacterium]|nr:glycosyltransferase family 2 protein [Cytophagaceae bacterium]MBK9934048.1 glycosyltransferase family 2 protein [Cytophagaceae bacterium]MBL0300505.1 glycosyltransferase family 2 protein [Cytophagaceae bacterium]MBL0327439.1 glycosyltransferase family 2 protein [Cytophagaceae bacterium]